jgi:TRAP-type C4-dicarboxylate transport system permease small subunit
MRMSTKALVQKVLLVLFSAFLIWQSIELVSNIAQRTNSTTLGDLATQSILLNLFITGIFLVGYALPLNKLFPDSY